MKKIELKKIGKSFDPAGVEGSYILWVFILASRPLTELKLAVSNNMRREELK